MNNLITEALRHWIPYKLSEHQGSLIFDWLYTGTETYTEPFFDGTIGKCLQYRKTSKPNKHLSAPGSLIEWSEYTDSIQPTAFMFHISRCGSTLVSQALGLDTEFISLSEVPVFDSILRLRYSGHYQQAHIDELLKAAISFYGTRRNGTEKHLFIKTDSWHLMFYEQLRRIYPHTPFIILYREPLPVLQSNHNKKGMQGCYNMIEPELFGLQKISDEQTHPDIYIQLVLEKYFEAIINICNKDNKTLLLNYNEGLRQQLQRIAAFTGIALTDAHINATEERGKYHAKHPDEQFAERQQIPALNNQYLDLLNGLYQQTETLRKSVHQPVAG